MEVKSSSLLRCIYLLVVLSSSFCLIWTLFNFAFTKDAIYLKSLGFGLVLIAVAAVLRSLHLQNFCVMITSREDQIFVQMKKQLLGFNKNDVDLGEFSVIDVPLLWSYLIVLNLKSSNGKEMHYLLARDAVSEFDFYRLKIALVSLNVQQYRRNNSVNPDETGNLK